MVVSLHHYQCQDQRGDSGGCLTPTFAIVLLAQVMRDGDDPILVIDPIMAALSLTLDPAVDDDWETHQEQRSARKYDTEECMRCGKPFIPDTEQWSGWKKEEPVLVVVSRSMEDNHADL